MRRGDRLFQIVQLLRRRRSATTAAHIAERLGISERTVYRDIADLNLAGTPIDSAAGVGYRLRPGYDLPPLMFTRDEIEALVLGARTIARSALRSPTSRYPQVMSELATAARPAAIIAKTARRVAVALTMSIGVGLLMMSVWRSSASSLFLRTISLGLSATAAFGLFEAWPRSLPQWLRRWALQVVAVGVLMPVTTLLIYALSTPQS